MKRAICGESGFTLIEVLIALTVFAVGLIALAGMQITAIQGNSSSQSISAKVALADGVIEEFMAMDGNDPRLINAVENSPWPSATNIEIGGAGTCSATVTIEPNPVINGITHSGLSLITVTVSNQSYNNIVKTIMKRRS